MTELEFCENKCKEVTSSQKIMIEASVKKGNFMGVAQRSGGSSEVFPACQIGKTVNIIDKAGYYQLGTGIILRWEEGNE